MSKKDIHSRIHAFKAQGHWEVRIDGRTVELAAEREDANDLCAKLRDKYVRLARDPRRCLPFLSPHVPIRYQPEVPPGCYVLRLCNDGWLTIEPRNMKPVQAPVSVPIWASDSYELLHSIIVMTCRLTYTEDQQKRYIYSWPDYHPGGHDYEGIAHVKMTVEAVAKALKEDAAEADKNPYEEALSRGRERNLKFATHNV